MSTSRSTSLLVLPLALALGGCSLLAPLDSYRDQPRDAPPTRNPTDPADPPADPNTPKPPDTTHGASMLCENPSITKGTAPGGGIPGTPMRLDLPADVTTVRMRVDGSLALVSQPPYDASLYNVRVVAVHLAAPKPDGGLELIVYDPKTDAYHVQAGSAVMVVPIWQLVAPIDRDIPASSLAVDVDLTW